jgi:hypothetical protein
LPAVSGDREDLGVYPHSYEAMKNPNIFESVKAYIPMYYPSSSPPKEAKRISFSVLMLNIKANPAVAMSAYRICLIISYLRGETRS